MNEYVKKYVEKLTNAINQPAMQEALKLAQWMKDAWQSGNTIYFCGNGDRKSVV
jgi:phosphoheptose isomerase